MEDEKQGKKFDVNFAELGLDKTIDFILIFIGLYAAIGVQKCQDDAKEQREYAELLANYSEELKHNGDQKGIIEAQLAPLQKTISDLKLDIDFALELIPCGYATIRLQGQPTPPPEEVKFLREKVEGCAPVFKKAAELEKATGRDEEFKPIRITPFYRTAVNNSSTGKPFPNQDLRVQIEGTYGEYVRIETLAKSVEDLFNDSLMAKHANFAVLSEEVLAALETAQRDPSPKVFAVVEPKLTAALDTARSQKRDLTRISSLMKAKVDQLTERLTGVDEKISATQTALETEKKSHPVAK